MKWSTLECPSCGEAHNKYTGMIYPDIILEALERCASIDLESARCYRMEADYCQAVGTVGISNDHNETANKLELKAKAYRDAMKQ